jgi:hypothetical protein
MDGWERLGRMVATERARRWRSRADFARAAGISTRVIDDLEKGRRGNFSPLTLSAIEAALGWQPGAAMRVVQGGAVRRMGPDERLSRLLELWPRLGADAQTILVDLVERAVAARDD